MPAVVLRYWAAAKHAAGTSEELIEADTLADALTTATNARPGDLRFAAVLKRSSFLVDSNPVGQRDHTTVQLSAGATVEVLPAFAGG